MKNKILTTEDIAIKRMSAVFNAMVDRYKSNANMIKATTNYVRDLVQIQAEDKAAIDKLGKELTERIKANDNTITFDNANQQPENSNSQQEPAEPGTGTSFDIPENPKDI